MNHPNPEAVGLDRATAAASTEAIAAKAAAASEDLTVSERQRLRTVAREPNVGVRAAQALGFGERDRRPLTIARVAHRRRRLLVGRHRTRVGPRRHAGCDRAGADGLEEISPVSTVHLDLR